MKKVDEGSLAEETGGGAALDSGQRRAGAEGRLTLDLEGGARAAGTPPMGQGTPEAQEDHCAAGWPGGRGIRTGQGDEDRGPRRARAQTRSLRIWNRRQ